ncbi:MAG: PepSY domain-containing protein, partial [Polaromonas sp.]|nr:PepSY domain-containing protein [Polaromonas sp.]
MSVAGWIAALVPPPLRRAAARPWVRIVLRLIAALPGGYAFTAALVALLAAALPLLGLARSEAVVSAAMLGFVLYLLVLLWAFSVRSLA